jgi:hypothetical protein
MKAILNTPAASQATGSNAIPVSSRETARSYNVHVDESKEVEYKRAATEIRHLTGWAAPVDQNTCRAYVATREASVEPRRRRDEVEDLPQDEIRRTRARFRVPEVEIVNEPIEQDPIEENMTEKRPKKAPAFKLASPLQQETDIPQLLRQRILEAEVTLPLKSLLGLDGTRLQEELVGLLRRKRQEPKKANEAEVVSSTATNEGRCYKVDYDEYGDPQREAEHGDHTRSYWARATPGITVVLDGIEESLPALIDHGSEINVVSANLYRESDPAWPLTVRTGWTMKSANGGVTPMMGAIKDLGVSVGSVREVHNFFVQDTVSFPVILGQPFIHRMRMATQVLDSGVHFALLRSTDGTQELQVQIVRRNHSRNRMALKREDEPDFQEDRA